MQITAHPPGTWLGVLGGGQLGRMFCHAAQMLGYRVAVLDPAADSPAGSVADRHIRAGYEDEHALDTLGRLCAAVTTEFENVPAQSLARLAELTRVTPGARPVAVAQDRIQEKAYFDTAGIPVAPYAVVRSADDLAAVPARLYPGILKAARLGYDGKGQARVASAEQAREAWQALGGVPCVLEALQPLASELSVIVARGLDGQTVAYVPAVNVHQDGILAVSSVDPASDATPAVRAQAIAATQAIAQALDYHGVLCVEFFVLQDGRLLANEMAPRPHNSGHHTLDACITSQFAQQARVMAGLPLGAPDCLCASIMLNILGDVWFPADGGPQREPDWAGVLVIPGAQLHLYGKAEPRPGRKMGHVTILGTTIAQARERAAQAARALSLNLPGAAWGADGA